MTGAMFTGIGLTLAAGAMSGNCMLPMKYARQWRPENVWFVFSIVSLLVLPWALAFALVNQPIEVYRRLPMSAMMAPLCFGAGWGIAKILFGVSIRRLGMSVGYAIIVGLGAVLGGKLRGQLQLSEETKKEMVLNYQKTISGALRDASDALIAVEKQRVAREQQEKLVAAAQDATRLARMRYQGGATSYLEVLTTDSNFFSAELNLVNSREGEAQSLVQLYEALGGGWE